MPLLRTIPRACVAIALIMLVCAAPSPQAGPAVATLEQYWDGFDPRRDPLEWEAFKTEEADGVRVQYGYFTGETYEGVKTRVYAIIGEPAEAASAGGGQRLPGILHIHGGGQTAYAEWCRFWARRGYVCVSFDFCGDTNLPTLGPDYAREHFTKWGKVPANMMNQRPVDMWTEPRANPWYHWTLTARRALTLLESQPRVDPERLGAHGTSVGGVLSWMVSGSDSRLKAIVPIYGIGFLNYALPGQVQDRRWDPKTDIERRLLGPENYAPGMRCPVLYLSGTQDGFPMDSAYLMLDLAGSAVKRALFTPRYSHHIEPPEGRALVAWMNHYVKGEGGAWPESPTIEVLGADGGTSGPARVQLTPDRPDEVQSVDIYYCLSTDYPGVRFWRGAEARRVGNAWVAEAPVISADDEIYAFANLHYPGDVEISSRLLRVSARDLAGIVPTLQRTALIDAMATTENWNWVPAYTDPFIDESYFEAWQGPAGEQGFTLRAFTLKNPRHTFETSQTLKFDFATTKLGDPQWRGRGRQVLLIDVYGPRAPGKLTLKLNARPPHAPGVSYTLDVTEAARGEGWRTLRVALDALRDDKGQPPASWDDVNSLELVGESPVDATPVFRDLRWESLSE